MTPARTFPIRLAPLPGEALDSWLETLAARLAVPLSDLVRGFGRADGTRRLGLPDRTIALDPAEAAAITAATGLGEDRVRAMTLERYDQTAVILDPRTRMVNVRTLWGKSQGSRYCPDCLAGTGGRWQLRWRLSWSFACLAHRRLLADDCPRCGAPQRICGPAGYEPPCPGRCPSPAGPAPAAGNGAVPTSAEPPRSASPPGTRSWKPSGSSTSSPPPEPQPSASTVPPPSPRLPRWPISAPSAGALSPSCSTARPRHGPARSAGKSRTSP